MVTTLIAITTTQIQLLVEILRRTPKILEVAEVVEAVIIVVAINKKELLIVYQLAELIIPITLTQAIIARIFASTVKK